MVFVFSSVFFAASNVTSTKDLTYQAQPRNQSSPFICNTPRGLFFVWGNVQNILHSQSKKLCITHTCLVVGWNYASVTVLVSISQGDGKPVRNGLCSTLEVSDSRLSCKVHTQLLAKDMLYFYPSCTWGMCLWELGTVQPCLHSSLDPWETALYELFSTLQSIISTHNKLYFQQVELCFLTPIVLSPQLFYL